MKRTAAVITVSDKGSQGLREDTSGPEVVRILAEHGYSVCETVVIPDDRETIERTLLDLCDKAVNLIVTTGGTGFSKRDVTPEATMAVIEREARGIPEMMRAESAKITDKACLSRAVAGIRGESFILNLPGSKKAARENLLCVLVPLNHGLDILLGYDSECGSTAK